MLAFVKRRNVLKHDALRIILIALVILIVMNVSRWVPAIIDHTALTPLFTTLYTILILVCFGPCVRRVLFPPHDDLMIGMVTPPPRKDVVMIAMGCCMVLCIVS